MRALILPAAAMALAGAVVLVGGRIVETPAIIEPEIVTIAPAPKVEASNSAIESVPQAAVPAGKLAPADVPLAARPIQPALEPATPTVTPGPENMLPSAAQGQLGKETARSRLVAPAIVAPPDLAAEELQREAPREPLSQLSLALPPKPEMKNEWAGTAFFRPVAIKSAVFESMGRTIAIAGVESVPLDESCDHEGVSWQCGMRARTAFRLWLRGRALVCQLPEEEQAVTSARCRLAKQDAGAWLVANGWALAAPGGPYVQAEEKARAAKDGYFRRAARHLVDIGCPRCSGEHVGGKPAHHDGRGHRSAAGSRTGAGVPPAPPAR